MADEKNKPEKRKKDNKQPDAEREQRAPAPAKSNPRQYRFDDWASI